MKPRRTRLLSTTTTTTPAAAAAATTFSSSTTAYYNSFHCTISQQGSAQHFAAMVPSYEMWSRSSSISSSSLLAWWPSSSSASAASSSIPNFRKRSIGSSRRRRRRRRRRQLRGRGCFLNFSEYFDHHQHHKLLVFLLNIMILCTVSTIPSCESFHFHRHTSTSNRNKNNNNNKHVRLQTSTNLSPTSSLSNRHCRSYGHDNHGRRVAAEKATVGMRLSSSLSDDNDGDGDDDPTIDHEYGDDDFIFQFDEDTDGSLIDVRIESSFEKEEFELVDRTSSSSSRIGNDDHEDDDAPSSSTSGRKNPSHRRRQQRSSSSSSSSSSSRAATKMFSKIRNNPVLAEALLMDLLQRQQRLYEDQQYEQQQQQQQDNIIVGSSDGGGGSGSDGSVDEANAEGAETVSTGGEEEDKRRQNMEGAVVETGNTAGTTKTGVSSISGSETTTTEPEKLTTHHFNTVMQMYIDDRNRNDGPQQALRIFYILLDLFYEYKDNAKRTLVENDNYDDDDDNYNLFIPEGKNFDKDGDDGDDGDDFDSLGDGDDDFDEQTAVTDPMRAFRPNFKTYSTLIYSLTKIQSHPEQAKEVVQLMMKDSIGYYDDHPLSEDTVGCSRAMEERYNLTSADILYGHNKTVAAFFNHRWNPFNRMPFPDKRFYNSVLKCYAEQSSPKFTMDDQDSPAARADGFLEWLETQQIKYHSHMPFRSKVNSFSYALVIRAWVSQALEMEGGVAARSIGTTFKSGRKDDDRSANVQLEALARAMNVMVRMKKMYDFEGRPDYLAGIPDIHTYYSLLSAFGRAGQGRRAEQVLDICIDTYLRHRRPTGNDEDYQLVAEPNTKTFSLAMDAWSHSDDDEAPERVEQLLQRMIKYHDSGDLPKVDSPNIVIYNTVIKAWSRSDNPIAPHRAYEILKAIKARAGEYGGSVRPDVITYTSVMLAFGRKGLLRDVEEVFELMFQDFLSGNEAAEPDDAAIRTYLNAMCTVQSRLMSQKKFGTFQESGPSDRDGIDEIALCSPERAEAFLERMEQLHKSGVLKSRPSLSYFPLSTLYAKSGRSDGPDRAFQTVMKMQEIYESGNGRNAKPSIFAFNNVLVSFSMAGNVVGAEHVLRKMVELAESGRNKLARPTKESYTILIDAHKRVKGGSRSIDPVRAERVFRDMEKLSKSGARWAKNLRPDLTSYSSLMDCYARASIGSEDETDQARRYIRRTEELLDEFLAMSDEGRIGGKKLTEAPFDAVLRAIAYSKGLSEEEDKVKARTRRILTLMAERNVPPSTTTLMHSRKALENHCGMSDGVSIKPPRKERTQKSVLYSKNNKARRNAR